MRTRTLLVVTVCLASWLCTARRLGQAQPPDPTTPAGASTRAGMADLPEAVSNTGGTLEAEPMGSAFTYQGRLILDGVPVNGVCDLQFDLWDSPAGGALVASTQTETSVVVQDGLLTLQLDFGAAFNGAARWLAVAVRCPAGSGSYEQLSPRQSLTAAPYALYAGGAPWVGLLGMPAGFADAVDDDTTYLAGAGLELTGSTFSVDFGGSGSTDRAARSDHGHTGTYWELHGNGGTTAGEHFLGTTDGQALELRVDNARALRLEPNSVSPNVIGGHGDNSVSADVVGATVGGGGALGAANQATDSYGTIAGGYQNRVGNQNAFPNDVPYGAIGGGERNTADGSHATVSGGEGNAASGSHAAVGGGFYNTASGYASTVSGGGGYDDVIGVPLANRATGTYSTVGGGVSNTADGFCATVGGGESNVARGEDAVAGGGCQNVAGGLAAVVPGGEGNVAEGNYSFAAGRRAWADHPGAFVWADSAEADLHSERNDQFRVQANGGVRLDVNSGGWVNIWDGSNGRLLDTSTNAFLSEGGVWTNASGRDGKEGLTPVDGRGILLRLAQLPIATWSYRAEGPSVRHIGPTAEDFAAAFGLGQDNEHIGTVDADGVSLAAIQGLYQLSQEQAHRIGELEERIAALEALVASLARE